MEFLSGFYSDFALELLSSIDYISIKQQSFDKEVINRELKNWNNRKRSLFSNQRYLDIAISQLKKAKFI